MESGTKRWIPGVVVGIVVALAVAGWFLLGSWMILRPPASEGPLVRNGVAAVVVCGGDSDFETQYEALDYVPRPSTGVWDVEYKGDCTVWFHFQSGE